MFGLRRRPAAPPALAALYDRVVAAARAPDWYRLGGVPDTVDGRFDMLALVVCLVTLRLQREGRAQAEADLIDRFAADLDSNLRELGVGDLSISRQVGIGVGGLGGRLGGYTAALAAAADDPLAAALARNLHRGADIGDESANWALGATRALAARIDAAPIEALLAGEVAL